MRVSLTHLETTFTAPVADSTPSVFQVQITDNDDASSADEVSITVNQPPVADAGTNVSVLGGETVTLNVTSSSDPDGEIVSYIWT